MHPQGSGRADHLNGRTAGRKIVLGGVDHRGVGALVGGAAVGRLGHCRALRPLRGPGSPFQYRRRAWILQHNMHACTILRDHSHCERVATSKKGLGTEVQCQNSTTAFTGGRRSVLSAVMQQRHKHVLRSGKYPGRFSFSILPPISPFRA